MYYIATKFGFISSFYWDTNMDGKMVYKAKHCMDVREALPFKSRRSAEAEYRKTYMSSWWHCVLSTNKENDETITNMKNPAIQPTQEMRANP